MAPWKANKLVIRWSIDRYQLNRSCAISRRHDRCHYSPYYRLITAPKFVLQQLLDALSSVVTRNRSLVFSTLSLFYIKQAHNRFDQSVRFFFVSDELCTAQNIHFEGWSSTRIQRSHDLQNSVR